MLKMLLLLLLVVNGAVDGLKCVNAIIRNVNIDDVDDCECC